VADARLRALSRAADQGDVEARARLLALRLRTGDLERAALEVAAYVGDPAARLVLGPEAPDLPTVAIRSARAAPELNQRRWITGLRAYGKPWLVRAALAVAHDRAGAWAEWDAADERPRRALDSAAEWLACPCDEHVRAADVAHHAALGAAQALLATGDPRLPREGFGREGLSRLLCAAAGAAATAAFTAGQAARAAAADDVLQASTCVLNVLGGREDTEVIRRALVAAALA
jgi:hypothetical protein